jgi:hypothetical protein
MASHNSKFGQLLKHHKISGHIFFLVRIKGKPHIYWIKIMNFVMQKAAMSTT